MTAVRCNGVGRQWFGTLDDSEGSKNKKKSRQSEYLYEWEMDPHVSCRTEMFLFQGLGSTVPFKKIRSIN